MKLRNYSIIGQGVLICLSLLFLTAAKPEKVVVNEAIPNSAEQGATVPVLIKGNGFAPGATVAFWRTGTTNPGGVTVLAVTVHDSQNLTADIDVALAADIDNYDIEVRVSRRKGKGTELFSIKQKGGGNSQPELGDDYTATDGVTLLNPSDVIGFDYHITGTSAQDEIYGGSGLDLIEGGDGDDIIESRGGADEIYGDDGRDNISAGAGDDLVFGGNGDDSLVGDAGDDVMFGGAGFDHLDGGSGTDWLDGGDGDDYLYVSLGSLISSPDQYEVDHYDGGPGYDQLVFPSSGSATEERNDESVIVDVSLGTYQLMTPDPSGLPVTVNGDFFNFEGFSLTDGADSFFGADSIDISLGGGAGNDVIHTFDGNDNIDAGFGDDVIYGGDGDDFIRAEAGNDTLYGEGGNDILSGYGNGGGDETGQDDELWGGDGCDVFTFTGAGDDTIMDFGYPYDQAPCDTINYAFRGWFRVDYRSLDIEVVGDDIVITLTIKRGGGSPSTVTVKNAVLNGITVDESNITFIEGIR
jgi:Ca2+-binding RTX toxin-like protein